MINYRPQTKFAKVLFLHESVILSTGVCAWSRGGGAWFGGSGAGRGSGPGGVSSWGGSPGPQPRGKLRGIWFRPTPKGEVEGDLVQALTRGGSWGEWLGLPAGYCCGRYASYWNAFLLFKFRLTDKHTKELKIVIFCTNTSLLVCPVKLKCIQIDKEGSIAVRKDNSFLSIPWVCSFS